MKKSLTLLGLAAVMLAGSPLYSQQSNLNPGDIVFVAANADAPDTFAFVPLVDITAGTVIHFSDNSRAATGTAFSDWRRNATGEFSEAPVYSYVAPTNISAGTKISVADTTHFMGFATAGDTLLAFQGSLYNPEFIAGIGWSSTDAFITSGSATSNNSYLPSTLSLGSSAVELGNLDNFGYTGTTSGSAATLATNVNTTGNWTGNDTTTQSGPASLTVSSPAAALEADKVVLGYNFGPNAANYNDGPTVDPAEVTLSTFALIQSTGVLDSDGKNTLAGQGFGVDGGLETGALNIATSQAFEFTLTVDPGLSFNLDDFGFAYQLSTTGTVSAYYSTNGFASSFQLGTNISVTTTDVGTLILNNLNLTGLTGDVDFRFYVSSAGVGTGVFEVDEVWIQGAVVPEPTAAMLLGSAGMMLWVLRRKRTLA